MAIIENRRARFEYELLDTFTAGMVLEGWEVKSISNGAANIKAAWVNVKENEAWLENFSVSPWKFSQQEQLKNRPKKLLLHKKEIQKIAQKLKETGHTVVPLKVYTQKGYLKCEIAIARGRKKYEKRQVLKDRDAKKTAQKMMKRW